jgi:hypothetical protein
MFWLNNIDNEFTFLQIFTNYTLKDDIYDFLLDDFNLKKYNFINVKYNIKIKDNLILFENTTLNTDSNIFLFKITENIFYQNDYPFFKFKYEKNPITKMPFIKNEQYDFTNNIELKIYTIDNNLYYIIENNYKSYFITNENETNISKIKNILQKNN